MKISFLSKLAIVTCLLFIFSISVSEAQKKKEEKPEKKSSSSKKETAGKMSLDNFSTEQLEAAIMIKVNSVRKAKGLDTLKYNEILTKAARDQADYMAGREEATTEGSGKKKTTGKRVLFYGGSESADELVASQTAAKGKDVFTYDEITSIVVDKWAKGKLSTIIMNNSNYIYTGVGIVLEPNTKKLYISNVFGSFNTFNIGPQKRKELPVPYTVKKFGLKPYDEKDCKACLKFQDIENLQKGLYVKDGLVYFKYANLKAIQKLIKQKRDGLAVDIIQREQYPCAPYNIYDPKLISKGVYLKRKWSKKIFKKNLVKKPQKTLDVVLGKMPKNLTGEYELNLHIIQNKKVCKVVTRKYLEDGGMESLTPLDVIPDTVKREELKYKPVAETKTLTFIVPFDKNKYTYETEDIIPFIASLNEPEFSIDQILLSAYSSIEGDSVGNAILQRKRAESIMMALEKMQKKSVVKKIEYNDSWELFKKQVAGTKYAPMALMSKRDVKNSIGGTVLLKEMEEPILSKERYAEIKLTVTYDIAGPKEENYVTRVLKKAIEKKDAVMALNIQQYMIRKYLDGDYKAESILGVEVPKDAPYASLLVNKVWVDKFHKKDTLNIDMANYFNDLAKLAPKNPFAAYNSLYGNIKLAPLGKEKNMDSVQTRLQDLYTTTLNKDKIDALNLEFQFKIIDALDPVEGAKPIVQKSVDRIRSIYRIESSTWQNALKLAYLFMRNNDYEFSMKILEPYVDKEDVDENLLFAYISLTSYKPEKFNSHKMVSWLRKAKELNNRRYCKLFGAPYLTYQILENPFIKDEYCKSCESAKANTPSAENPGKK